MERKYDRINVVFEITDDFVDGGIERTRLEKDSNVVSGIETTIEKILDIFVDFMEDYGFQKSTTINAMKDLVEYETK